MIVLRRLDLVRQDSHATAEELSSLAAQINALPVAPLRPADLQITVGPAGAAAPLPAAPVGYMDVEIDGIRFVMPFYQKA